MKREIGDYIEDVIRAIDKALKFVNDTSYEEFIEDDKTIFAVVRALEIIGEAVKNIPSNIRKNIQRYPGKIWQVCEIKLYMNTLGLS